MLQFIIRLSVGVSGVVLLCKAHLLRVYVEETNGKTSKLLYHQPVFCSVNVKVSVPLGEMMKFELNSQVFTHLSFVALYLP